MDKYALGTDIPIRWTLGEYTPAESVYFEIYTGAGRKRVTDFTIDENVLSWTFSGSDQSAYGVYGLHLIAGSQEYRLDNAFELIHGTPSEQPEPQSLSSSVDIDATTPQEEPSESTEPAEYVSDSPIHVEKIPLGSNIILNWNLLTTESFDFDLEECDLALYYSAAGSGKKQATDFTLLTGNGYTVQWNFAGADQTRYGLYSLFLDIYYEGEKIATLVREDGFALVHRRGSEFLADRIISFDSVVTTLGGGALYSLADVLNDGYSTVYREDGETPAAQGDILLFDGEKWVASNDADLGSTDRLAEQITALTTRVSGDEDDIAALGRDLAAAQVTIGSNTSRIARNEADILDINTALSGLSGSIRDLNEDVVAIQISEAGIATRVTDAEGNISSLQQTAAGFDLRVSDVEGDVGDLSLTATALAARMSNAEGDIGVLELTATGLTTRVTSAEGDIGSLQLTSAGLTTRVSNAEGDIGLLQLTAAGLTSRISDTEGNVSLLQQTATGLQYQVDNQSGDIATLKVSAQGLTSRVSNAEGDISSIQQQADSIELSVEGLSTEVTRYEGITDAALANLQDQIDGVVETWYFEGVPTLTEPPVMSSLTHPYDDPWLVGTETPAERTEILNNHIGDLYYEKITGKAYRFMYDDTLTTPDFVWTEIADEDIAKALALAGEKKRVFVSTPTPPYDLGDLWAKDRTVNGTTTREIYKCITARAAGTTPDIANDWVPADNYGYEVNKSNLEVLAHSITSSVAQYSYNSDGTLATASVSQIIQDASSIRLATVVNNVALAGITIDAANQTGSVTIFSDNFYIKDGSYNKTALAITHDALGNSIIDVDSINVNGILSAPRILSSKIEMVDGSNNVTAGLSGIYDSTKTGYGMAAWYGGPMVDLADHLTDNPIPAHAKSLFRMDGSGYLADRAIYWSDQGDLHLNTNIVLGDNTPGNPTINSILTFMAKFGSWFVEDTTTMTGKTLLRINMGSQSSEGFDGLIFDGFLVTGGDQIVGSGTPGGGGGGGASYLYQLNDTISSWTAKPSVSATQVLVFDPSAQDKESNTGAWKYVPATDIGRVYSGGTGITIADNVISVTANTYVDLTSAQTISATKTFTTGIKVTGRYQNSGDDEGVVVGFASNNYAGVCLGNPSGVRSVFYMISGSAPFWRYNDGTTSYNITHPGKTGTIALTSDIPTTLPASDVYAWAKAATKPSYTFAEITNKIVNTDEFNFAQDGFIGHIWINYRGSTGNTAASITEYRFGSGTNSATYAPVRALKFIVPGGTSSQFLKADGSTDSTEYLPLTGGMIQHSSSDTPLRLVAPNTSSGIFLGFMKSTSASIGYFGFTSSGTPTYANSSGTEYTIYHSGNSNKSDVAWACSTLTASGVSTGWTSTLGTTTGRAKVSLGYFRGHGLHVGSTMNTSSYYLAAFYYNQTTAGANPEGTESGNPALYIRMDGNVGIGTSSPGYKFHVVTSTSWAAMFNSENAGVILANNGGHGVEINSKANTSTYNLLNVRYNQTTLHSGGDTALLVRADGDIGLGAAAPTCRLDVLGRGTNWTAHFKDSSGAMESYLCYPNIGMAARTTSSASTTVLMTLQYNYNATAGTESTAFYVRGDGNVGIGTSSPGEKLEVAGNILINASSYTSLTFADSTQNRWIFSKRSTENHLHLIRYTSAQAYDTVMAFDYSAGNVGIGTNAPTNKLHVIGTSDWTGVFQGTNSRTVLAHNDGYGISVGSKQNSSSYYLMSLSYGQTTLGVGGTSAFYVRADGNIGIGTISPGYKLHVNGSFCASRELTGAAAGFYFSADEYGTNSSRRAFIVLDATSPIGSGSDYLYMAVDATGKVTFEGPNGGTFYFGKSLNVTGTITSTGDQAISSDIIWKTNLQPVKYTIEDIAKCRAVTFDWKDGRGKSAGSIAQDWKPLIPELVHGEEGNMTLAYGQIALVNSILLAKHETEQDKEIKKLKNRVKELENEVKRLRS